VPDGRDRHAADPGVLAIENSDSRESESHFYGGRRVHRDIFPRGTVIYGACPGWDSNPHLMVFETIPSTGWGTGAQLAAAVSGTMTMYLVTVGSCR
jgi:hypothetical protein